MVDLDRRFARSGDGPSDPMSSFLGAVTDLGGKGWSGWRVLGPIEEGAASFGAMFPRAGRPGASADAGPAAVSQVADMSPAIAQAGMVAAASTMRYWRALADLHARYQPTLMHLAAHPPTGHPPPPPPDSP